MATSAVIGNLRVDLGLDSAQFQRGAVRAQAQMKGLQNSTKQLQRTTSGLNFRMLLPQLSQVAQQTAATGQPMRALAVQAADIGLAFGPLGIAIGAIAGLALPALMQALGSTTTAAETFANAAKATDSALSELNSTVGSISGLERDYREALEAGNVALAERIAKLIELRTKEAELLALTLPQQISDQAAAMRQLEEDTLVARDAYEELVAELERLERISRDPNSITGGGFANEMRAVQDAVQAASAEYVTLSRQSEIARVQTEQLRTQLEIARDALGDAREQTSGIVSSLTDAAAATSRAALEAAGLDAAMSQATVRMNAAAIAAGGIVNALRAAVAEAMALASVDTPVGQSVIMGGVRPSAGDIVGTQDQRNAINQATTQINRYQASLRDVASAAGGPGGAASAVERFGTVTQVLDRILAEANRNSAQEFKETLEGIGQGAVDGFVDQMLDGFQDGMDGIKRLLENTLKELASTLIKSRLQVNIGTSVAGGGGGGMGSLASMAGSLGPVGIGAAAFATGYLIGDAIFGGAKRAREKREAREREAQSAIDGERGQLILAGLQARGDEVKLRKLELATISPANRALQLRVWAIEDEAEASERARAAEARFQAFRERVLGERSGLEERLLQLTGNTERLRERELEALDPSNRALLLRINAIEDEKAANEAAASAASQAAAAAEELANSLRTDQFRSLFDYQRAVGFARNGVGMPIANLPNVPMGTIGATGANTQAGTMEAVTGAVAAMASRLAKIETYFRKWDGDGLPKERNYA
jgi:hypothetical protein